MPPDHLPLTGLLVIDLSQFLAGPYASLRLQDLGARVIKVERPGKGDLSRSLYLSDTMLDGDSTIFHAINRGKQSIALDLKNAGDMAALKKLISKADVVIQNFRPGVIERLGLGYDDMQKFAPHIVYGSVSGYGPDGPWARYPGQDLLAQARSGVMWLNGDDGQGPVPFGLAIADMFAGANLVQGILASLVRKGISGTGCHVETSLLESMIDFQFEMLATHLNDGGRPPRRATHRSAHAGLSAPYGVYQTLDGYIAIAMTPIDRLADLLGLPALDVFASAPESWFAERDTIKQIIATHLADATTDHWLALLEPHDIWCAKVLEWQDLLKHEAFQRLDMLQSVERCDGRTMRLTRSPLRINGHRPASRQGAPSIGADSASIRKEFDI
ncbi:CaiB/BaiF CoA-transferase family protein [Paracoccus sp. Z330]|uniref:CaiB/BaiF CoA-transferase family protein n=1 Tax=Paracoccus onchidii TaxID=3017813 RepID=A0ABT4ZIT9_9RHOB|nr:CaiB/BaiF CoA-transferase family protein [Paracoccus onchidii]MDB6179279.1 CaiB/BaiF CoA-transferase family protein [Paracoccus onchidii]